MWIHRLRKFFQSRIIQPRSSPPSYGILGNRSGVIPTGVVNEVWVTLFSGQVVKAINSSVPHRVVPVSLSRSQSGRYVVESMIDLLEDLPYPASSLADSSVLTWPNSSTAWIRYEQIISGIAIPDGLVVRYYGSPGMYFDGAIRGVPAIPIDLSEEIPESGAEWVAVGISSSYVLSFTHSPNQSSWEDLSVEEIVRPPSSELFLFAVRVYVDQVEIRKTDNRYNDLFDPRFSGIPPMSEEGVESVTGDGVDNTDPANPVMSYPTPEDIGAAAWKGNIDLSANPNFPAGTAGDIYRVSVAGTIGGVISGKLLPVNSLIICTVDNAGGLYSVVGTSWRLIPRSDVPNGTGNLILVSNADGGWDVINWFALGGVTNGNSHDHVGGDGAAIVEAAITLADNTTNDATITKHGLLKKLSDNPTEFMNGQGDWATPGEGALGFSMLNGILTATVDSNALTVAIKTLAGNDPSAGDPVKILFRNATAGTGDYTVISLTAATSFVVSSGSTLGTINSTAFRLWIVGFNDEGTFRLGIINCLSGTNIYPLRSDVLASSTAEGGAGAADAAHVIYTGTAVTTKAMRILGYAEYSSGLATAGTWASAPTKLQLFHDGISMPGQSTGNIVTNFTGEVNTGAGIFSLASPDAIPQNTSGNEFMTQAITPISAANILQISSQIFATSSQSAGNAIISALFRDSTAGALRASWMNMIAANGAFYTLLFFSVLAGSASATTFKVRAGGSGAGTTTFNGSVGNRFLGGTLNSYLRVEEIMA